MLRFNCFRTIKKIITIAILLLAFNGISEISEIRQKQLDSIVTNLDKSTIRNLDSLHFQIHSQGLNDEERVFMFYGYFAIHCRYDYSRKGNRNPIEYTPYYTARAKSGVCRDFSALFKELCRRSNIPCLEVYGRCPGDLKGFLKDVVKLRTRRSNHSWNVVKFNGSWHHMDPTWSTVLKTEKYYGMDEFGRRKYLGKVKIPMRRYYDCSSEFMFAKRSSTHPAFYLSTTVPTFKTARKSENRRKIWVNNYGFSKVLDSLANNPNHELSNSFRSIGKIYCHRFNYGRVLSDNWNFLELKRTQYNPLTTENCQEHLESFKAILTYLKNEHGNDYKEKFQEHEQEVKKVQERLKRKNNLL